MTDVLWPCEWMSLSTSLYLPSLRALLQSKVLRLQVRRKVQSSGEFQL
jgi:hypothetical protein